MEKNNRLCFDCSFGPTKLTNPPKDPPVLARGGAQRQRHRRVQRGPRHAPHRVAPGHDDEADGQAEELVGVLGAEKWASPSSFCCFAPWEIWETMSMGVSLSFWEPHVGCCCFFFWASKGPQTLQGKPQHNFGATMGNPLGSLRVEAVFVKASVPLFSQGQVRQHTHSTFLSDSHRGLNRAYEHFKQMETT